MSDNLDFQWWVVDSDLDYQKFLEEQQPAPTPPAATAISTPAAETNGGNGANGSNATTTTDTTTAPTPADTAATSTTP